jgi:hypothetical protein
MTVIDDIISQSFSEYDTLPVSAKIILASRLVNSIGSDLSGMRDRFWHDANHSIELPKLRQDYSTFPQPATPRPTPGRRGHDEIR